MTMIERPINGFLALIVFAVIGLGAQGSVADPQCKFRSPGQTVLVGSCVCLMRPGGKAELACCGTVLNNPSWKFTGKSCPVADGGPALPATTDDLAAVGFDAEPMVSNMSLEPVQAALAALPQRVEERP